ncbi:MAG: hypothetical protein K6G10_04825 [Butyrivibrio sp.]|nr:hypothetical protein [Butyrivibrio sp.]
MILAQYTIRSKQDYIFKTNKMIEIIGASANISRAWDELFEVAKTLGLSFDEADDNTFDIKDTQKRMEAGELTISELFRGGGNLTVLFDSFDTFKALNRAFSYKILVDYPGMIPMAVYTDFTGDYRADYAALMNRSEIEKSRMYPGRDEFILPFSDAWQESFESFSKKEAGRKKSYEDGGSVPSPMDIAGTGPVDLLAVVHADGNNMGSKIMKFLRDETEYDKCVNSMRLFTKTTSQVFNVAGLKAVEEYHEELVNKLKSQDSEIKTADYRLIVADGDDLTFICNAKYALEYTRVYLNAVRDYNSDSPWKYSSCAGISLFHRRYPFADAYSIAEQVCDSAKKMVHTGKDDAPEEGWVDFQFITGTAGDLDTIRDRQNITASMARPWLLTEGRQTLKEYEKLAELEEILRRRGVTRTVIKELGNACESSIIEGRQILERVYARHKGLYEELTDLFAQDVELLLRAIYDLSGIMDIWFEGVNV